MLFSVSAAFTNSIAGSGNPAFASGLSYLAWSLFGLSSFPRAMLIMSGSFGLWRARLISNAQFAVFVLAVVLVLAGGTTWLDGSVWAPDGLYSRVISPMVGLAWVVAVSRVVFRSPATRCAW